MDAIAALELAVLRALCASPAPQEKWAALAAQLSAHRWREPDHKVVYDALRQARARDAKTWRDQLPAQTTRMGFPDLDWSIYLEPKEISTGRNSEANTEELIRDLKESSEHGG